MLQGAKWSLTTIRFKFYQNFKKRPYCEKIAPTLSSLVYNYAMVCSHFEEKSSKHHVEAENYMSLTDKNEN